MTPKEAQDLSFHLAKEAGQGGEVPVGAVLLDASGKCLAASANRRERDGQVAAHAECLAIICACQSLRSWRLAGCSLYVTLEPCLMCAGAIFQSRISYVCFGARDPKNQGLLAVQHLHSSSLQIQEGPLSWVESCQGILKSFFQRQRVDF